MIPSVCDAVAPRVAPMASTLPYRSFHASTNAPAEGMILFVNESWFISLAYTSFPVPTFAAQNLDQMLVKGKNGAGM